MQKKCKRISMRGIFFLFLLLTMFGSFYVTSREVQAATNGFVTKQGKTYYYVNGKKKVGWLTLNGKKYYFYKNTGVMATGWVKDSKNRKRYFYKNTGIMATGLVKDSKGEKRFFDESTGLMTTGWQTLQNGKKRYFYSGTGYMATGWVKNSAGKKRYFYSSSGYMATGLVKSGDKCRYFDSSTGYLTFGYVKSSAGTRYFYNGSGYMATGWVKNSAEKYRYFDPETGYYATGTRIIDDFKCVFNSSGYLISKESTVEYTVPNGERTIKNYLLGAIQPVGQALYVWGGGWTDSTLKGVSPAWKEWYDKQNSSYDYNNYRDLSASNRAKGLDCSGFVGWSAYQIMQKTSGVGSGYTVVSGEVGSFYKSKGWGTILTQSDLYADAYTLKAGDVGYNSGHTWIVIGQCKDKSVVIVHSTPNAGCQISGTPTPSGNYVSEAIALAQKYMKRYEGYSKFNYHTSSGNYVKNGNYLRWNSSTLSDPDGYLLKTADQILEDLFS